MKTTTIPMHNMQIEDKNPTLLQQAGFTLIELSIVLVIIGLIVGGVLVGQDLIKAAEIRSTIGQYEKYNTAINTFRSKYNGIPGDLTAANAGAFGLPCAGTTTACTTGVAGMGNGDGLVSDPSGTGAQLGDPVFFWSQLSSANLVDGSLGQSGVTLTTGALTVTTTPALFFPPAKMGRGLYWLAGAASGQNYYLLAVTTATTAADATLTANTGLTPLESYNIDTKVDDGMPNVGTIQARGGVGTTPLAEFPTLATANAGKWTSATVPVSGDCTTTGAAASDVANTYARGTASGTTPACLLRLRFN